MEIKHGRIAMAALLHVIVTGAGYKGRLLLVPQLPPLKFDDIPAGTGARANLRRGQRRVAACGCWFCECTEDPCLAISHLHARRLWAALPQAGWAQIVCLIAILDNSLFAQDPNEAPGDVAAGIPWVRTDPSVRCPGRTSVSLLQPMAKHVLSPVPSTPQTGQGVEAQRRAQQRPWGYDGHYRLYDPRGPHWKPDLADRL